MKTVSVFKRHPFGLDSIAFLALVGKCGMEKNVYVPACSLIGMEFGVKSALKEWSGPGRFVSAALVLNKREKFAV